MRKTNHSTLRQIYSGNFNVSPIRLTIIQSVLVIILASIFAAVLFNYIGIYYHSIWYQLFATLIVSSILAPIFLYPSFRTTDQLRKANLVIERQATTDHLTALPNMLAFSKQLSATLKMTGDGDSNENIEFALHFIDLDRFKQINDTLGHDGGNQLLIKVANRLSERVGASGFVARFGGDEFVVIQYSVFNELEASRFAQDLRAVVSTCYHLSNQEVSVGATIGTALVPRDGNNQDQILKAADMALYKAKSANLPQCIFDPGLASDALTKIRIEGILRSAIKTKSLKPYFHSIVHAENPLRIVGFEALARIELFDGEILRPDEFIPVAESTGVIIELGEHILRQACMECLRWNPQIYVAVNVSPTQLIRSDFFETVYKTLEETGLEPGRLELEITESVLIGEIAQIRPVLNQLRELGVRIALDDFGSGYCGLHYLRNITIDKIKVDKSIIDDAGSVLVATNILRSVSQIAREMGLTLTAEGIDTVGKAEFLAGENCAQELQGFLFSQPVGADDAFKMQEFYTPENQGAEIVSLPEYAQKIQRC
jgi:diguanylate cyclase (GGDEF)-like protein